MPKRLIVSADDFGETEDGNTDIINCYTRGAVTDMGLIATGRAFEHAVTLARKNNINKVGVHLALTCSFKPASPTEKIPSLLTKGMEFYKNYGLFLARYFAGLVRENEIYLEFKNQIERIRKEGFEITHLNSHQHIHMAPGILKIAIQLMKEENIKYVRFSEERISIFAKIIDPLALLRHFLLLPMCFLSKRILNAQSVKHNDYYMGHARALKLRKEDLYSMLSNLKDGLTELGCHPGKNKEEAKVFCENEFLNEIKRRSIELISY